MRVLAVEVDERPPVLGQLAGGRQPAVDVGPGATLDRHHPGQHHLLVAQHQPALDQRLTGPRAHQRGLGPAAHQQPDRLDQEGLAGPRLSGERGQARPEQQPGLRDHPEITYEELEQHQRSDRPNLALRIWWKRRGPKRTKRTGSGAALKRTLLPWPSVTARWPSMFRSALRCPTTSISIELVRVEHEGSIEQHVGRHRRQQERAMARRHDGPAGRQRVGRGAGRGRHDETVRGVGGERRTVDADQQAHRVAGLALLDHGLVQRPPRPLRLLADRIGRHEEHHALLDLEVTRVVAVEGGEQRTRLDLGEVAELPDVDAQDVRGAAPQHLDRAQHGAVAAQADGEVGLARRPVLPPARRGRAWRRPRRASRRRTRARAATGRPRRPGRPPRLARDGR